MSRFCRDSTAEPFHDWVGDEVSLAGESDWKLCSQRSGIEREVRFRGYPKRGLTDAEIVRRGNPCKPPRLGRHDLQGRSHASETTGHACLAPAVCAGPTGGVQHDAPLQTVDQAAETEENYSSLEGICLIFFQGALIAMQERAPTLTATIDCRSR